ncbi:uncharacterized protein HGUI_00026 [Hanseniaspora guilliermondii]|uniref:Uncharacterized protein n=1 Tax=Hanseniaspora guilliermondii TaxID=56406 RepID=A0A1L0ATE0_9ASCO|nr:uncharacterized protein HGUI_00026 [Hanseniaspora guilliermondii]
MLIFLICVVANTILNAGLPLPISNTPIQTNNTMSALSLEEVIKQQNMLFSSDKLIKMDLNHDYQEKWNDNQLEEDNEDFENEEDNLILTNSNMEYDYTNVYSDDIISEYDEVYDETRDPQSYAFHFRQFMNDNI